jgi:hypothetical protein
MLFDSTATDPCFVDGRAPRDLDELLSWARLELRGKGITHWRLVSARTKLGRTLVEIEDESSGKPRRFIGKLGARERAETLYNTLTMLRQEGFCPPALFTVPEPIGYFPERGFVLQEKVPGQQASDFFSPTQALQTTAAADSARWLAALHGCPLLPRIDVPDPEPLNKWEEELVMELPAEAARIRHLAAELRQEIARPRTLRVPCHGDFHPMNIFIAGRERITGIDIDKFARREPESDIGWFVMQTAARAFFQNATFQSTIAARRTFLQTYQEETGRRIQIRRAGLYIGMAFLKNLHFELVLLKTGRSQYADPWLSGAAAAMRGDIEIQM